MTRPAQAVRGTGDPSVNRESIYPFMDLMVSSQMRTKCHTHHMHTHGERTNSHTPALEPVVSPPGMSGPLSASP